MRIVDDNQGMPGQGQPQPLSNQHLKDAEDIVCESCEGNVFEEKIMLKKISRFITGQDRDSVTPIPVIACAKCNHINEMFKPKF